MAGVVLHYTLLIYLSPYSVYIKTTLHQQRENQAQLESHIANLTQELTQARGEVANLRIEKEELELKADAAPSLERKRIILLL
jgi:cell division protein FtsL